MTTHNTALGAARNQLPSVFLFSILANLLLLTASVYTLLVIDRVMVSGSFDTLIWLSTIAILAVVACGILDFVRRRILYRTGQWVYSALAAETICRSIYVNLQSGISGVGLPELSALSRFAGGRGTVAILDAVWTPLFIALICFIHPVLGIIAIGGVFLLLMAGIFDAQVIEGRRNAAAAEQRRFQEEAQVFVDNAETLAGLGMVSPGVARWTQQQRKSFRKAMACSEHSLANACLGRAFRFGLQIAVFGSGAALVLQSEITSGEVIAVSILFWRALAPAEQIAANWQELGAAREAYRRLKALWDAPEPAPELLKLPKPSGRLEVDSLRYFAPSTRAPLIKSVSFRLEPGQICAVVGASGSGKSNLCRLLVGAWRPSFGEVRLDGVALASCGANHMSQYVGYLPQNVALFSASVAENIARLGPVDDENVVEAARKAGAHETVLALPQGYGTNLDAPILPLSGGQRQQIGLARALYRNPSLVVLDEPESSLDQQGKLALYAAITAMKAARQTVVMVTHNPDLIRRADRVAVMQGGALLSFEDRADFLRRPVIGPGAVTPMNGMAV